MAATTAALGSAPTAPSPTPNPTMVRHGHRADLDGLRAIAILIVVAYHAGVPGFAAGFIGVDVFFVLSGFLITRIVDTEVRSTGALDLTGFWLRRARRLLPAATLTIAAITVANQFVLNPLELVEQREEPLWGLAYLANHFFASEATDYFNTGGGHESPFLHLWSLAVEEQFYVVWPLVFFGLARLCAPMTPARSQAWRVGTVAAVTAASFVLCISWTTAGSPWAFYSAVARAWEFGAGALLALILPVGTHGTRVRSILGAAGVGTLLVALRVVDAADFPGTLALLPVAATLLLIAAEPDGPLLGRALRHAVIQYIGRISYSWYLVHWPVLVLGERVLDSSTLTTRVLLAVGSVLPAVAMHHLIENRLRFNATLQASTRASLLAVLATMAVGFAVFAGSWVRSEQLADDPTISSLLAARADRTDVVGACAQLDPDAVRRDCGGGSHDNGTVLVLGDSHAAHWIPGVSAAADRLDMGWAASVMGNCPATGAQASFQPPRCFDRQGRIIELIDGVAPSIVVVSHSSAYVGALEVDNGNLTRDDRRQLWADELAGFAGMLRERDIELLVVLDVPRFADDPLVCAAEAGALSPCTLPAGELTETRLFHEAERDALRIAGHGTTYDPLPWLCDDNGCPLEVDGTLAYADSHHLTASVSAMAAGPLAEALSGLRDNG